MKKPITIRIDLYQTWVLAFIGCDNHDMNQFLFKHYGITEPRISDGKCFALSHPEHGDIQVIHVEEWKANKPPYLSLLSHECLHAASNILHRIGLVVSPDSIEALTWLHQQIFQMTLEQL